MSTPTFLCYPDRFLGGTADFSQGEIGAYWLLLLHQWNRGSCPVQLERLQTIARGPVSEAVLSKFRKCDDGHLRNDFMEEVRRKDLAYREKQRQNGIRSGESRRTTVPTVAEPPFSHGSTSVPTVGGTVGGTKHQPNMNPLSRSLISYKTYNKGAKKLSKVQRILSSRFESALGTEWVNDAGKWVNRVKKEFSKCERVAAEVESAIKEKRIKTTPARYAEQIWKEFK